MDKLFKKKNIIPLNLYSIDLFFLRWKTLLHLLNTFIKKKNNTIVGGVLCRVFIYFIEKSVIIQLYSNNQYIIINNNYYDVVIKCAILV